MSSVGVLERPGVSVEANKRVDALELLSRNYYAERRHLRWQVEWYESGFANALDALYAKGARQALAQLPPVEDGYDVAEELISGNAGQYFLAIAAAVKPRIEAKRKKAVLRQSRKFVQERLFEIFPDIVERGFPIVNEDGYCEADFVIGVATYVEYLDRQLDAKGSSRRG